MIKFSIVLFLLFALVMTSAGQSLNCDPVVNYQMKVTLNPESKTITGTEVLNWKNTSDQPISELYFHAYLNAFKNTHSTFFKEAAQGLARYPRELYDRPKDGWGFLDIQTIFASSAAFPNTDLLPTFRYVQPDDQNPADETVFVVRLPRPISPNESVDVNIAFVSKMPHDAPRTEFRSDYFFVGQWFPKIAVLENGKWNCHQFHTNTEFYADYGSYDVSLTLPKKYVVGATGVMTDSTANSDGSTTYRFQQDCIHDFAWTACPRYKVASRMFEHPELPSVRMRLLYQPEHQKYVNAFFDATANTLKHYGLWYVPYPYKQITIVDAAWRSKTGGMEYPTLFTTEVDWLTPEGTQVPHSLTVHEAGHQFWYGLIGNNEFEDAWLDEGFNSYSDTRCENAAYGARLYAKSYLSREGFAIPLAFPGVRIEQRTRRLEDYRSNARKDAMGRLSFDLMDGGSYDCNAYEKPALMLWTLEGYLGDEVFGRIMKTYASRYIFKHPKPQDFINVVNELAGQPMDWFFQQMLQEEGILDYAVTEVSSRPFIEAVGLVGKGNNQQYHQYDEKKESTQFASDILVRRLGEMHIPVDVRIQFEDGEIINEKWDGSELWKRFSYIRSAKVMRADVDPEQKLVLDFNYSNNSRYRESDSGAAIRWASKWMYWLQHLLETVAFFS